MKSAIPIQNLYYLLCYAWNRLEEKDTIDVASLDTAQVANLFARVLASGTQHVMKRGFDRGYIDFAEDTGRLRGRIDFAGSLKRNLFARAMARCEFDDLDYNVLHNRILKSTIADLIRVEGLDAEHKEALGNALRRLREVDQVPLSGQIFRRVQLHRNNNYYRFLLNVCELIHSQLLVSQEDGKRRFRDFLRDEVAMRALFEDFVKNFYSVEQSRYQIKAKKVQWAVEPDDDGMPDFLPEMKTDVCLISKDRKIILDCKYYQESMQAYHGTPKARSTNLYQLFAYLKNQELVSGWEDCEGILLYPTVNEPLDFECRLHGHRVRIVSIDLNQEWQAIERDLLNLVDAARVFTT